MLAKGRAPAWGGRPATMLCATALATVWAFGWPALEAQARTIERTIQISTTGEIGDANRDTVDPYVAYNPHRGEYLVAWSADGLATGADMTLHGLTGIVSATIDGQAVPFVQSGGAWHVTLERAGALVIQLAP